MACDPSKNHTEIYKIGQKFINDPEIKRIFRNASDLVYKKHHQLFGWQPSEWRAWEPSKTDIKAFKDEIKLMRKHILKNRIAGNFASGMYTTSALARRNPIYGELYNNFLSVNHAMKGRQILNEQDFSKVLGYLRDESLLEGMSKSSLSFKKAQKRANKIEKQIQKLRIDDANGLNVKTELAAAEGKLDAFISNGEGKIYKNFIDLVLY